MNDVIWRAHPLYAQYEVSDDGRVRSVDRYVTMHGSEYHANAVWTQFFRGRELKTFPNKNGYRVFGFSVSGDVQNAMVHRWVCETFHGLPSAPSLQACHVNGNSLDNRAENLYWGTARDNQFDRIRHGRHSKVNQTHCQRGHEFTPENTLRRADRPENHRQCLTCKREIDRARSRRNWRLKQEARKLLRQEKPC